MYILHHAGRLKFSKVEGVNKTTGKFDKLYAYGGRSFSIWRASDMSLVYDSGSEVERHLAEAYPSLFNANGVRGSTPTETKDARSDDKVRCFIRLRTIEIIELI